MDKIGKITLILVMEKYLIVMVCFKLKKELYVLFKFLNFADRNGLKVIDNVEVRRNIHKYMQYAPNCDLKTSF